MTEVELVNGLLGSGGSITAVGVFAYLYYRATKAKDSNHQVVMSLLKADQATREKHTEAITKLTSAIDEFNRVNGSNQKECLQIREAYSTEVTRLNEIADRCEHKN